MLNDRLTRLLITLGRRVIDFIKLHYYLSKRTDSQFWLDNTDRKTIPDSLLDKLDFWQHTPPSASDFFSKYEVFQLENYQYVLYGMEFNTQLANCAGRFPHQDKAETEIAKVKLHAEQVTKQLGSHRELIEKIKMYGIYHSI